jgi:hypothetical protein
LKTIDYLERYQGIKYSKDSVYRFLDRLCGKEKTGGEADIKHQVEQISFRHTRKVLKGKISVVFYDMTTLLKVIQLYRYCKKWLPVFRLANRLSLPMPHGTD